MEKGDHKEPDGEGLWRELLIALGAVKDPDWPEGLPNTALWRRVLIAVGAESKERVIKAIQSELLAEPVAQEVNEYLGGPEAETVDGKQARAKRANELCRKRGFAIRDPWSHEACWLVAINDKWGGKYALENIKTKKRSSTSRTVKKLLPLRLMPIPLDEE